jgi:hypothetical protein
MRSVSSEQSEPSKEAVGGEKSAALPEQDVYVNVDLNRPVVRRIGRRVLRSIATTYDLVTRPIAETCAERQLACVQQPNDQHGSDDDILRLTDPSD